MNKYIGDFLGFKLFSEQDMPKECLEHMEKSLIRLWNYLTFLLDTNIHLLENHG